jgi:hypothetical protein
MRLKLALSYPSTLAQKTKLSSTVSILITSS